MSNGSSPLRLIEKKCLSWTTAFLQTIRRHKTDLLLSALLGSASLFLFIINNDFKIGLHVDERRKIVEALSGSFYFLHPLFLPMTMKVIGMIGGLTPESIYPMAVLGRTISAVLATTGIVGLYALLRSVAKPAISFAISAAIASTPLVAVHAHYIKEDCALFAFCCLSVLALARLVEKVSLPRLLAVGLSLGLAVSSKYIGVLLLLIFGAMLLILPTEKRASLKKNSGIIFGLILFTFVLVNLPGLFAPMQAKKDIETSIAQAIRFQDTHVSFGFYMTNAILPDMGIVLGLCALTGIFLTINRWRLNKALPVEKIVALFFLLFYLALELSPYKAWPDYSRLSLPLLIPFAFFSAHALQQADEYLHRTYKTFSTAFVVVVIMAFALPHMIDGIKIVLNLKNDTRIQLAYMLRDNERYVISERQASLVGKDMDYAESRNFLHTLITPSTDARYYVNSSMLSDPAKYRHEHKPVPPPEQDDWLRYQSFLDYPYCKITPNYRSYAYSNPTIRVFNLPALKNKIKADPATNGAPCTKELLDSWL